MVVPTGPGIDVTSKLPVAPAGSPETDRVMRALKPPETDVETPTSAEPPGRTETDAGKAEIVKFGLVTINVRDVVRVIPPPEPLTVNGKLPGVVAEEVVRFSWKFAVPAGAGPESGANEAVTPAGKPVTENERVELKPPTIVSVTVAAPEAAGVTVTVVGATERLKSGLTTERVRDAARVSPPPVPVTVSA